MRVAGADFKNGMLMLKTNDADALKFARTFKQAGDYEIVKSNPKRSLDANRFAWELIGKLASAMSIDKDTVYRSAVCAVGAFEVLQVRSDAVDAFARVWANKGLSWLVDVVDDDGQTATVRAYYGSSVYDKQQMSALIEYLKQDCESIGIEVDNGRIASLLEEWNGR